MRALLPSLVACASFAVAANCVSVGIADEKADEKKAAMTPEQADADYPLQGEFAGSFQNDEGEIKFGVQVIALGNGKFRAVGLPGGLPGDGWTRENRVEVESETVNGQPVFKNDHSTTVLTKDALDIQTPGGEPITKLKRLERKSPTLGAKPPEGAVVLFDGKSADNFEGGKVENGLLLPGITSKQKFGDCTLHLEFMLSYMPNARGQGRSNSGCYIQGRHEVQILDSFGLEGKIDECGAIYNVAKPGVNMCFPPLAWQTYDIDYTAAKYEDDKKTANAKMTVRHNGVVIHRDVEIPDATRAAPQKEGPGPGPIYIQDHSNPLRFRNIWVVEKKA